MNALIVILVALCGLAALEPTERQVSRSRSGRGRMRERVALLRQLGLLRR